MADRVDGLIISEILADNAGGSALDTDGDGSTNKADEFIEIQNTTNSAISLEGFEIWTEKEGLLYSFDATDTIDPGGTATVVGNYSGTTPNGFYDGGAAENSNWIADGEGQKFNSVFLVNSQTGQYVVISYGNPPRTPTLPTGFPGTTQVGSGEAIDSNAPNGTAFARDANGDLIETTPTPDTPGVACFATGTSILTAKGWILVQNLEPGDMIETMDHGLQPLRAICSRVLRTSELLKNPHLRPIAVPQDGDALQRPLLLSPAHRVLLAGPMAELLFTDTQVLVPAHHLVQSGAAYIQPLKGPVTYFHLLMDRHEIINADNFWVESMFAEVDAPHTEDGDTRWKSAHGIDPLRKRHTEAARPILRGFEAGLASAYGVAPMVRSSGDPIRARAA